MTAGGFGPRLPSMEERIHYEPHPVSRERRAELRAQGLTILDAQFAPEGWRPAVAPPESQAEPESTDAAEPKRRGRPPKARE